ncbi:MAG: LamG-like jellyroll fold domain-containing protein [Planctomycetota bacterium]
MKTGKIKRTVLAISVILLMCGSVWAEWSVPMPLDEVNTEYSDGAPFLSFDGLTFYFARWDTSSFYYTRIYKATRAEPFGPFTSVEEISELNYSGGHVSDPWVSSDNLRMYYFRTEPGSVWRMKFSERASVSDPWPTGINVSELNSLGDIASPSLTEDELIIVFSVGESSPDLYIASRTDTNSLFSDIRELTELNTVYKDQHPSITADGLTLLFASNRNENSPLYKATRTSLSEPFGNIEQLSFFYTPLGSSSSPFLSSDGKAFYFSRTVDGQPIDNYVSYWIENVTYHVDGVTGDNGNDGLSRETAFETIQYGIDEANDLDTVLVWPGVYVESVYFIDKAITVKAAADAPILEAAGNNAVSFYTSEGQETVLSNFVIRDSDTGIFVSTGTPTISNITLTGNGLGIEAENGAVPDIRNCIFWNNTNGDLWNCTAQYSFVEGDFDSNLVAYWKLDGDAVDSAGSNDGTIYGTTTTTGQVGDALAFNYVDDHVALPDNDPIWLPQENFTLSCWVYFNLDESTPNDFFLDLNFCHSFDYDDRLGYGLARIESGNIAFLMYTNDGVEEFLKSVIIAGKERWYHVTAVRDGTTQTLYIDGDLENVRTCSVNPVDFEGNFDNDEINIGRYSRDGVPPQWNTNGLIDDVRIYDRALSASEIEQMYEFGLAGGEYGSPLFADANSGDYHLLSERGRYRATTDEWILDEVSSPCIDGGEPNVWPLEEPMPNGGRINMGAYGNTTSASMSEWGLEADLDYDGIVANGDVGILSDDWLEELTFSEETTGSALQFDGVDDYVIVQDDPILSPPQITLMAWIHPEDVSKIFQIIGKWEFQAGNGWIFDNKNNNDALRLAADFGGGDFCVTNSNDAVLTAGTWQHVAVTWNGSLAIFYVNGENAGEDNICSGAIPDALGYDMYIGYSYSDIPTAGGHRPFDGTIDEVAIYNRALTVQEIEDIYHCGVVVYPNLVGYWDFEEGKGQVAADSRKRRMQILLTLRG